jgi:N-acetylneuraminic acid mutarotase
MKARIPSIIRSLRSTAICLALLCTITLPAYGITVTSTVDTGSGSLRRAVADATGGDTIDFSVTGTITLTNGQLKSVTLSGPDADQLRVQRSHALETPNFWLFDIAGSKSASISGLTTAGMALQSAHRHAAVSESLATPKRINARKSTHVEFSASRQRVGGREIAGFSVHTAPEQTLTPPAGLKPVEKEAWLAMARRQGASGGMEFSSFYPARYGEPFVVEGEGVRVAVRPVGGTDAAAQIANGQVIYHQAYPETDSMHEVSAGRSEEFLFLQDECAPREFAYELSELSAGTRVELVKGEVRFTNKAGQGVKIEAPWLIEANGVRRADAVHWELEKAQSAAGPQRLRLVVATGLRYPVVIDPSWTVTGDLGTARSYHTATLLTNGKVLVAGGADNSGVLSSAELYDPATGTWTATGSLGTVRDSHTATLLTNGKVLVVGGVNNSGSLSSAELYDPASGTWTATGSMGSVRFFHTATLLPNGKVLVAGGLNITSLSSAELYDPATGSWSTTGSLGTARRNHTATLLPSGKVLVAGGFNGGDLSGAELYDPATGSWSTTGSLGTARDSHTATLLPSGKVLVAAGFNGAYVSSAELYDPATGSWSTTSNNLGTARDFHTATLLPSGKVLVVGGYNGITGALSSAELYDPATGSWSITGSMGTARAAHTATLLPSGKVLVAGGAIAGGISSSVELYDPATGSWSTTGSLITARAAHTATLLPSGKVLVAAGFNGAYVSSAELYDPATGSWSNTGSLGTARERHTATLLPSGKVLVAGGENGGYVSSAELYDPATGSWSTTGSLGTARRFHTATLLPSGKVLVAGGYNGGYVSSAELYDPATGSWSNTGSLNTARELPTATLLPSGKVLVVGGTNGITYLSSAELYDPASGTWTATGSLGTARRNHTATLLPSGKVLVAGGFNGGYLSSAELYDPATGSWSNTSNNLGTARYLHTATLLASGKVLVAGGGNAGGFLSSAELYDQGLRFDPNWQPLLTTVSPSILPSGSALTASGSRFKGISEASGGNGTQNSSSNYPLVQLLSLANEQTLFLPVNAVTGWSNTSFTSTPITLMTTTSSGFPIGYALVTVFTNGIPSQSKFVLGATPTPSPTPTPTATATFTPTPTPTATATATATATFTPTPTPTATATFTPTPTATATFTPTPTPTVAPTPTPTSTPTPTPTPSYVAEVQPPINADGTSVFNVHRGVVPVKFTLTLGGTATCDLPPATISLTRTAGGATGEIDESVYSGPADTGSNFRIDSCQYVYNLSSSALGVGTYRVDITINTQVVGSATFQLR